LSPLKNARDGEREVSLVTVVVMVGREVVNNELE
jgi:hypothetical protein